VRLLEPVARALERAHNFSGPDGRVSIVHRDLKPENIFVAQVAGEQTVKILDFGIGKAKSVASQVAGRASQDVAAMMLFTPAYGAPEQWVPKRFGQTGPWTDVWGIALTVVEAVAGKPVMSGDPSAMMGTALDTARRPTPRSEGVTVSDAVEAVFTRALAVDPRERYADAGAFWNDLTLAMKTPQASSLRSPALIAARTSLGPSSLRSSPASRAPGAVPASGTLGKLLERDADTPLLGRVLPGAVLIGIAVLLTLADQVYAAMTGEVFALGPLRASLIGGLLLLVGVALLAYKLLPNRE